MNYCEYCGQMCPTFRTLLIGHKHLLEFCDRDCCDKYIEENGIGKVHEVPKLDLDKMKRVWP